MIRYDSGNWPSSRRCGYRCFSDYDSRLQMWAYYVGTTYGGVDSASSSFEQRCNCPIKYGPGSDTVVSSVYVALCETIAYDERYDYGRWVRTNSETCPKGWGKWYVYHHSEYYSVKNAQGYSRTGTDVPVYGYVTRYRDAYYNYMAGRVSKA